MKLSSSLVANVHEFANRGAKEKNGKMSAAEMASNHYDPGKTKSHHGATGGGGARIACGVIAAK